MKECRAVLENGKERNVPFKEDFKKELRKNKNVQDSLYHSTINSTPEISEVSVS